MLLPINALKTFKTPNIKANKAFKDFYRVNNPIENQNSIYNIKGLNFKGYNEISESDNDFYETIKQNYFKLPQITLDNGTKKQIMPDKNQLQCARELYEGKSVLFATGTGNGKTATAHYIMTKNLYEGKKSVYTVPIKALANDKYREFREIYGEQNVGLLTGETKINPNAPIIIMITEIYDKQISSIVDNKDDIATVIYDEAHYISDKDRGTSWENSIINSAKKGIQTLFLSATIGNSDEFCNWISELYPDPNARIERIDLGFKDRNVPLVWYLYKDNDFTPIYDNKQNNPSLRKIHTPRTKDDFSKLITKLKQKDMLPAIVFKQSQKGCDEIVDSLLEAGLDLTSEKEKEEIKRIIEQYNKNYCFLNLNTQALICGFGAHHAAKLPQERRLIEELFSKKLLKAIAATTTLSAGINMPTRTTVICSMTHSEYNQKTKEKEIVPLSTNEFHQMTGRAGRRGIDSVGNVILYNLSTPKNGFKTTKNKESDSNERIDELALAYDLLISTPDKLRSQFKPQPELLAQYFEQNSDFNSLRNLVNETFKVHLSQDKDKTCQSLMKKFQNLSVVLLKQGFIFKNNKQEFFLTPKGYILEMCQGANPLILASLLYDEKLKDLNPAQLCQIAGYIANPNEKGSNKPESKYLAPLFNKQFSQLTQGKKGLNNFRQAEETYLKTEAKIIKSQLEAKLPFSDIKEKNSFSGYIVPLWFYYNQQEGEYNSNNNFRTLLQQALSTPSNISEELEKEFNQKATEGNTYKTIAQSISVLEQINRICDFALSRNDLYANDTYWTDLQKNIQTALRLVKVEPFNNEEIFKNL